MRFKVGDKVKIREDLKRGYGYYKLYVNEKMLVYADKTGVVKDILFDDRYVIEFNMMVNDTAWHWTEDMLEPACIDEAPCEIGHIIECRNGNRYYVHCKDRAFRYEGSLGLKNPETLVGGYEIVKEYKINEEQSPFTLHNFETTKSDILELVWEKKEVKEMTVAEIEKVLGYGVKIVKESEEDDYAF